jgi:hypothetical protein
MENDQGIEGLVHYAVSGQHDTDYPYGCDVPNRSEATNYETGHFRVSSHPAGVYELARLYYRASYLCKAYSKCFGQGVYSFGSSRRRR